MKDIDEYLAWCEENDADAVGFMRQKLKTMNRTARYAQLCDEILNELETVYPAARSLNDPDVIADLQAIEHLCQRKDFHDAQELLQLSQSLAKKTKQG